MENHPLAVRLVREKRPEFKSCFEYSELIGDSDASLVWSFLGDSFPCVLMSKMKVHHRIGSQGDSRERLSALIGYCFVVIIATHVAR